MVPYEEEHVPGLCSLHTRHTCNALGRLYTRVDGSELLLLRRQRAIGENEDVHILVLQLWQLCKALLARAAVVAKIALEGDHLPRRLEADGVSLDEHTQFLVVVGGPGPPAHGSATREEGEQ